ncbi:MAG TPA: helix-turn-helix domain-containing protein [Firmicutes bacterium]|nr:helix-turn-helix domain-containing protein [Bacillota bacterium]
MPESNGAVKASEELTAIGELLRTTRLERGLTLEQAQEQTKIRRRYLEALENGDPKVFPGEVYMKGFIKNYGQFLGLPGEELVARYNRAREKTAPQVEQSRPQNTLPKTGRRQSLLPVAVLAGAALVGTILLIAYSGGRPAPPPPGSPAAGPTATPEAQPGVPGPGVTPGEVDQVQTTPAVRLVKDLPREAVYEVQGGSEITLEVKTVGERCWLATRSDGGAEQSETLTQGMTRVIRATTQVWLRAGDPGAVELAVNGVSLGRAGAAGVPRNITIELKPSA